MLEALERLGGRATSRELLDELLNRGIDPVRARMMITEAVREGVLKKLPDHERGIEVFALAENPL